MAALFLVLAGPALAQNRVEERDNFHNTAYIKTDDEAVKTGLFRFGESLGKGNHPAAVSQLLAVLNLQSDALVPLGGRTFLSVRETVIRHIVRLPAAALDLYLEKAGQEARPYEGVYEAPWIRGNLLEVVRRYPLTAEAFHAMGLLGRIALEKGSYLRASRWFQRSLDEAQMVPGRAPDGALLQQRSLACYTALRLAGREREARAFSPQGTLRLGDRSMESAAFESLFNGDASGAERDVLDWPARGGSGARDGRPQWSATQLEPLWVHALNEGSGLRGRGPLDPMMRYRREDRTIDPVVLDGVLYLFDETAFHALDLATGEPLYGPISWDWSLIFGEGQTGLECTRYAGTAGDGKFYAVMNQRITAFAEPMRHRGTVVCLDLRRDGYLDWIRGGPGEDDPRLAGVAFSSAPVLAGNRVFFTGTRYEQGGEARAEAHLYAFDRESGRLLFDRFICSGAEVSRFEIRLGSDQAGARDRIELGAPLAESGGVLYALTNLGVTAAVDAFSGEMLWAFKYNRIFSQDPDQYYPDFYVDTGGWDDSLPVVQDGRLYFSPEDSRFFYCIATSPDPEGFIVLNDPIERSWYRTWLGMMDDRFFFSARQGGRYYFTATGPHGEVLWTTPPLEKEDRLSGQPFLTAQTILVPTVRYLYRLDLRMKGLVSHAYPIPEKFISRRNRPLRFGNIITVGDYLVSVSKEDVMVFKGESSPE